MPTKLLSFLLIGSPASKWQATLQDALPEMGELRIIEPDSFSAPSLSDESSLFIIDATYVENVPSMIQRIRGCYPHARVLVVTSAPSWSRARDAFQAGAVDYVKKSLDIESVRRSVQLALAKKAPSVP